MDKPTSEQLSKWKAEYDELGSVTFGSQYIVYRPVTFREFDQIARSVTADKSTVDVEDELVDLAVLWPEDLDSSKMRPGHVSALADAIRETSCLDGEVYKAKDVLDMWRSRLSGIRGEMYAFIMFALPQYKDTDLDELTFYRLGKLVALSEKVISLRQAAEGVETDRPVRLEIYTPEEIEEMGKRKVSMAGNATAADPIAQKLLAAR